MAGEYDARMQNEILSESAGSVLFSAGPKLVFANRGTSYRRVLLFVLALLTLIFGVNGIVWLVVGIRSGETPMLGILLAAVAALAAFGASRVWAADQQERTVIPGRDTWVAVLDLETRALESPAGEPLAPLSSVRFAPVMQLGSSSRALAAKWPDGSLVVYRGHPFAGSIHEARAVLQSHGVETS